jgi:hypothetical protein
MGNQLKYTHQGVRWDFHQAVKEGYSGKFDAFEAEVLAEMLKGNTAMQKELYTGLDGGWNEAQRLAYAKAKMNSLQRTYSSSNKHVRSSVDRYALYYESMNARGKKLGLEAFLHTNPKGYLNRVYREEKINEMGGAEKAVDHLVEAQVKFSEATNGGGASDALRAEFRELAKTAVKAAVERTGIREAVLAPLTGRGKVGTSALQARTIKVFDEDLLPLIEPSLEFTSQVYGLRMHGNFALKETTGMHLDSELEAFLDNMNS